jgi:carbonic anhydrase
MNLLLKRCLIFTLALWLGWAGLTGAAQTAIALEISPLSTPAPNWDYADKAGPSHWAELDAKFEQCDRGQQQSPIALQAAAASDIPNLRLHYQPSPIQVTNNGRTLLVAYEPGSYLELEGQRFDLIQFHFHHPSEHRLGNQDYPMELHLVHSNASGDLAVIGVAIEAGAENQALSAIWENLIPAQTSLTDTDRTVDASLLLPPVATSYRYSGSLTTPPCSEAVQWIVMDHPIQLSPQQIEAFAALVPANNRPLQALNGRSLQLDNSP